MSDASQGPDWWLGSDGKWYPPVAPASPARPPTTEPLDVSPSPPLMPPTTPPPGPLGSLPAAAPLVAGDEAAAARKPSASSKVPLIVGGLVAVFAVLAGAFVISTRSGHNPIVPPTHTITGTMELTDSDLGGSSSGTCYGTGGYSDIRSGAQVVVKDASNKVIAQGALGSGSHPDSQFSRVVCDLPFTIRDVPDSDFYLIEVSHRGEISHTKQELEAQGWKVGFTLG